MVKGVSRRVIVVRSPDPRFFDEAIFIVKEDITFKGGISQEDFLREAQAVANGYLKDNVYKTRSKRRLSGPVLVAIGAGIATLAFGLISLLL